MATRGGLLIKLRERLLLQHSKVVVDGYPWLLDFMKKNPGFQKSKLHTLPLEQQNFFRNMFDQVVTMATNEWKRLDAADVADEEEGIECQLCHSRPLVKICYIANTITEKELVVGSECVRHFGMDKDNPISDNLFKEIAQLKRQNYLNNIIPGINSIVNNWYEELNQFEIVPLLNDEESYNQIGDRIRELYRIFLEQKSSPKDDEYIEKIKLLLIERDAILSKIKAYVQANKNKRDALKRDLSYWLKRQNKHEVLKNIKKCGVITWGTAHRIGEINFLKSTIKDFNKVLPQINIEIESIEERGNPIYILLIKNLRNMRLSCQHNKLILDFGWILFNETPIKPFTFEYLAQISEIHESSFEHIIFELKKLNRNTEISFYLADSFYNQLYIIERATNKYIIIDLRKFINRFKDLFLKIPGQTSKDVIKYVLNESNRRISKEDVNSLLYSKYRREEIEQMKI